MKRQSLLTAFLAIAITSASFAQTSTPEVPRNYKPAPKELLPMPDSLTENDIFPVLGEFDVTDPKGTESHLVITRDGENKGIVWVSGLPQGKFKALLKDSPATYKIPAQKTLANDEVTEVVEATEEATPAKKTKSKVVTGRSIQEGTMIFDKDAGKIYVNIGNKYNEEEPAKIFPEMIVVEEEVVADDADLAKKPKKTTTKKAVVKGTTYTGTKLGAETVTEATEATEATTPAAPQN